VKDRLERRAVQQSTDVAMTSDSQQQQQQQQQQQRHDV